MSYLLKSYQISYAYSSTLHQKNAKLYGQPTQEGVLAFAPSYPQTTDLVADEEDAFMRKYRDQLGNLVWNVKEVAKVNQFIPTRIFTQSDATEALFKQKATNYQILHLAMHALVDDEDASNSRLVFSKGNDPQEDGYLHLYELYGMQLKADLAVLSACNTGYGQYIRGEGIASLGRAFAYAGCPNVLISHWSVDDQSTSKLMEYFYEGLSKGLDKSVALQKAKLTFLEQAEPRDTHPSFWGGFVLIGDDTPIHTNTNYWLIASIMMIALGIIGALYFRKRSAS